MANTPDLLEEIAFHEAGHAVVGFVLGLKFQSEKAITIISDSNFQGRVYFEELPEITSAQQTTIDQCIDQCMEEAPAHLCVSFAGPLAQLHTTQADGIDDRVAFAAGHGTNRQHRQTLVLFEFRLQARLSANFHIFGAHDRRRTADSESVVQWEGMP